ncbi:MAG: hypothetical protein GX089_01815 [Fibrobacter sp.]|jgi:Icc protein|nr:hypothetical protein [Fibrobacter sp.]
MTADVSFIHISDTHIGSSEDFSLFGRNTFQCASRLIDLIKKQNIPLDFVVHTGDLINKPDQASAQLAKSLFSGIPCPLYTVNGNHDSAEFTSLLQTGTCRKYGPMKFFEKDNYVFLFIDAKGAPEIDPHGLFTESHADFLNKFLNEHSESSVLIFIHFPALQLDCPWLDKDMLLINGDSFHKLLVGSPAKISGVFFGHIHKRVCIFRDNILYSSAPSPFCTFGILPSDSEVRFEPDISISCNCVTLQNGSVIIKEITE